MKSLKQTLAGLVPAGLAALACAPAFAGDAACTARSGAALTPVIELYTSEGCSSCPPADQWASSLKEPARQGRAVVEAFHVGYWDYIGWVDRFASPAFTSRQRQFAALNGLSSIYTPQVLRNGVDWRDWNGALAKTELPRASLAITRVASDQFEATVAPLDGAAVPWSAYWTVTEMGHSSKVKAGENAGEFLKHDFVVRQYTPVGDYKGPATLTLNTIAADPQHPRLINLVVFEPRTGKPLQAISLQCQG